MNTDDLYQLEEKLKKEIRTTEIHLKEMRHELFDLRLSAMIGRSPDMWAGISNVKFTGADNTASSNDATENSHTWNITYTHTTDQYDENNYNNGSDSDVDTALSSKTTIISFGKNKKYFINGTRKRFRIYENSRNELRIINQDYDVELDLDEQEKLLIGYSKNKHIPEWLAIKVFLYMCEAEWNSEHIINYLSCV